MISEVHAFDVYFNMDLDKNATYVLELPQSTC